MKVLDTASVWDGETGFISLQADCVSSPGTGATSSNDVPCTWVGTLFSPTVDCILTKIVLNLRLIEGNSLVFRVVVTEWIETSEPSPRSPCGTQQGHSVSSEGWFAPHAKMPRSPRHTKDKDKTGNTSAEIACDQAGQPGGVLFCSQELLIREGEDSHDDTAYQRIECCIAEDLGGREGEGGGGGDGGGRGGGCVGEALRKTAHVARE